MPGDYSRKTFNSKNHYIGVLNQQGRVQLDADWNEQVELTERRFRAETVDIIGRCVVPKETPDGFKIEVAGGTFTIGPGRIYVDGMLAENHGKPALELGSPPGGGINSPPVSSIEFDSVLAEERGTEPVPYEEQPYLLEAPELPVGSPPTAADGPHLVYIDVWQREVTFLKNPDLIEKAVGIDTTVRLQTVWQVKILPNIGNGVTCSTLDDQIPGWIEKTRPSAGRLTTEAVGVSDDRDPCLIPTGGGYRGLENRLYRVEIHRGGVQGNVATFKWSRDNAIMASNVTSIKDSDQLVVDRMGFDSVMRFHGGEWVEITDDRREFSGLPGIIRRIKEVEDTTQTIFLTENLPVGAFPTSSQGQTDPKRHTRIKRWDQSGRVNYPDGNSYFDLDSPASTGAIPVPSEGMSIMLEDGVQITFYTDHSGGELRTGDYWLFAARTADASVEPLTMAPPKGIHHHYGRLAVVDFPEDETDCRTLWPQEGCCTVVVHPDQSIQSALDIIPETGGCVCLKSGTHTITEPIKIQKSNVVLHGESPGTKVVMANGVNLLNISPFNIGEKISGIVVEGVSFEVSGTTRAIPFNIVVFMDDCKNVSVRNCGIVVANDPNSSGGSISPVAYAIGVYVTNSSDIEVNGNDIKLAIYGVWSVGNNNISVCENTITSGILTRVNYTGPNGIIGIQNEGSMGGVCTIESNSIKNYIMGVKLDASSEHSVISRNEIARLATSRVSTGNKKFYAIDVAAYGCFIESNNIDLNSSSYGGIMISGDHTCIEGNYISSKTWADDGQMPLGIVVGPKPEREDVRSDYSQVRSNTIMGYLDGILVYNTIGVQVMENKITNIQNEGIQTRLAITIVNSKQTLVTGNQVGNATFGITLALFGNGNRVMNNSIRKGIYGISSLLESKLEASGNVVEYMREWGFGGFVLFETTIVSHNRFFSCGYGGINTAIGILFGFGEACVESCEVLNTGIDPGNKRSTNDPNYGINLVVVRSCRINKNRVAYTNLPDPIIAADRALLLVGFEDSDIGHAMVTDNYFYGPGFPHLVEIMGSEKYNFLFEKVIFSNNYCDHVNVSEDNDNMATVSFWGTHLVVMGNQVKASRGINSMNFNDISDVALMGNITTGDFTKDNNIDTKFKNLNIKL